MPPRPAQDRLVAEIETQFTRLDAAVATLERAQVKLKRARASVLKAAVEGRLVPTEAYLARSQDRTYEPASVLLTRVLAERKVKWPKGKKYVEPVKPDTEGLAELPEGWVWASVDSLGAVVAGIAKDIKKTVGRPVPYLRVANVQRGRLNLSEVKHIIATAAQIEALTLRPGDVLMNGGGDIDKLGRGWVWQGQIAECIHQNHVFRFRAWPSGVLPKYISHYTNTQGERYFVDEGTQTTNLASISMGRLKALHVAFPPLAEQHRIVAEVDRRLSVLDALDTTVAHNLKKCARLRQSILKRAFEGKLVPQEPGEPPVDAGARRANEAVPRPSP